MGAGVRPLVFLSSFKSTEGPHCCFVSKPLDLYLAVCIRDISSKNATSDGGFCVGYTKDGPRFAATSVKQTHAQRHGGGLQCLWNTSLQHVYAYITFFFFFSLTTNVGSTVIRIMQLPLFYCGPFVWPCPFRVVNIPPPPILRSSSLAPCEESRQEV